jgi:hypothetical protein
VFRWALAGRFAVVVAGVAMVGGLLHYAQRYAHARGEVVALERQRTDLLQAARQLALDRDSLRALGDTMGLRVDSLATLSAAYANQLGQQADSIVVQLVEVVPPDVAALVLRADSLRVAQVDSATARAVRAEAAVRQLREQLFGERASGDQVEANLRDQIANLELQVAAMTRVARTGWLDQAWDIGRYAVGGLVAGVASCHLGAPWCPS